MWLFILGMCALAAAGVFATIFLSLWSTRRCNANAAIASRQSFATELVWAAIPCLAVLAAAITAVIALAGPTVRD